MTKELKLLVILALTAQLSYSQNDYPKKILIGKDSLVAITIFQVKQLNFAYSDLDFYKELSDTFRLINKRQDFVINRQSQLLSNFDSQLRLKQSIIDNTNEVLLNYKIREKSTVKKIKWLQVQRNTLLIISVATLAKIFLFK